MNELPRRATPLVREFLEGFRAVVVNGPRQAGKSTVLGQVQVNRGPLITLDDPTQLDLARTDPIGFLAQIPPHAAIDEFQRGGAALLLGVKKTLDERNDRGQLLLAGSTRFLTTRRLAETLTGRVGIVDLLPLSAGEIRGSHEGFLDAVFNELTVGDLACEALGRADYAEQIAVGGFPELALGAASDRFRSVWCRSYLDTVTAPANVEQVGDMRRPDLPGGLVHQVAARSSGEIVVADLARELRADETTIRTHLELLQTLYLIRSLPAWTTSLTNRAKRRAVGHLLDTALACHLLGETATSLAEPTSRWFGPLLESFVVGELAKQATWCDAPTALGQYRDRDRREVDVIVERHGRVVAIEIKATATPLTSHARHIKYLQSKLGERFALGIILHTGTQQLWLGERIAALPVAALWADGLA